MDAKTKKSIIFVGVLLSIVVLCTIYYKSQYKAPEVSDGGSGYIKAVVTERTASTGFNQNISDKLETVRKNNEQSKANNQKSEELIRDSSERLERAEDILRENELILRGILERAEEETK